MEFQSELSSLKPNTENVHGEPKFDPVVSRYTVHPGIVMFLAARYYFQYRETPGHNRGVSGSRRDATVDNRSKARAHRHVCTVTTPW